MRGGRFRKGSSSRWDRARCERRPGRKRSSRALAGGKRLRRWWVCWKRASHPMPWWWRGLPRPARSRRRRSCSSSRRRPASSGAYRSWRVRWRRRSTSWFSSGLTSVAFFRHSEQPPCRRSRATTWRPSGEPTTPFFMERGLSFSFGATMPRLKRSAREFPPRHRAITANRSPRSLPDTTGFLGRPHLFQPGREVGRFPQHRVGPRVLLR